MSIPGGRRPAERPRDKLSLLRNHSLFRDLPAAVIEHLGSDIKFLNLPTRLAKTLLQLTAVEDGSATRRKAAVTQREISQMIGISRESTNKQLRAWAKRGWIRLERGGVNVVEPDKLAAIAIEGSEFDRSCARTRYDSAP